MNYAYTQDKTNCLAIVTASSPYSSALDTGETMLLPVASPHANPHSELTRLQNEVID